MTRWIINLSNRISSVAPCWPFSCSSLYDAVARSKLRVPYSPHKSRKLCPFFRQQLVERAWFLHHSIFVAEMQPASWFLPGDDARRDGCVVWSNLPLLCLERLLPLRRQQQARRDDAVPRKSSRYETVCSHSGAHRILMWAQTASHLILVVDSTNFCVRNDSRRAIIFRLSFSIVRID